MIGTAFQKKVWQYYQKFLTAKYEVINKIALAVENENSARAIGIANNKNPIPISIPCHRVIGSNAYLVGYAGGLEIKNQLLTLEKQL